MKASEILGILREHEAQLRQRGVAHIALFGSTARGDARPDSDIDLLVELEPDAPIGVFEYVGIAQYLEGLLPAPVDLTNRETLKPYVRPSAESDALRAF